MMKQLFLITFASLFIYINTASAEGGLSISTRPHNTDSEERYEDAYYGDEYYGDGIGVGLIWPGGVTGAVRRPERREDRRGNRERFDSRPRHR